MAYTTKEIVRAESPFKDSTNIGNDYVERAIAQADSLINSYLVGVYTLPLGSSPSIIQELSTKLATYNLLTDQNLSIEIAFGVNVSQMLEDAMAILDHIRMKKVKLVDANGALLETSDTALPQGYPNSADTESGAAPRFFTLNQKF